MEDLNNFRLQKISMIVADVLLVAFGLIFAFSGDGPMSPMQFFWVVVSVGLGGVLAFIPFFLEFKIRANLMEYDRSQANLENAERIERVLAEIHEIAAIVARQTDRAEEALAKTTEAAARLEGHTPGQPGDSGEIKALSDSVESLRKDVAQALESVASAEDTAALIGGIEVSLVNLSGQLEQVQYQLTRDAAARTAPDQAPAHASDADEAVEPSALETEGGLSHAHTKFALGDTLPADIANDETVEPDETLLAEQEVPGEETPEEELEGAEDVPEDLAVKDAAYEAEIDELEADLAEAAEELAAEEGELLPGDTLPGDVADDESVISDDDLLEADEESEPAQPSWEPSAEEELEGAEDVPEDLSVKDAAYEAEIDELESRREEAAADLAREEGPVFTDSRPLDASAGAASADAAEGTSSDADDNDAAEGLSQPNLMEELPPLREKPRKSPKGATVLVAQVLIGIGNKPYVRGIGPGLSPDEGVPMEFLEIGKWQWTAPDGEEPISCRIYKNDEIPADGDMIELEPGQRRTVSPTFQG
ncbi:hypothetical protein H5P28_01730 [Ruficoccus amylovorans]|uniref:Uncharacterized protein n=1 Tax=Ruficoccus amylovorans TaxID=1804625 RepID=A0A842H9H8_9BACT|nr:hypothetical protein [Ruficoccus amylovorans]MBC2592970.1 hypothetical protein [Ruficoccus amylovorans]